MKKVKLVRMTSWVTAYEKEKVRKSAVKGKVSQSSIIRRAIGKIR